MNKEKTPMQLTLEQIERALNITISDEDKRFYINNEAASIRNAYYQGELNYKRSQVRDITLDKSAFEVYSADEFYERKYFSFDETKTN